MNARFIDLTAKVSMVHTQLHNLYEERLKVTLEIRTAHSANAQDLTRADELERDLIILEARLEQAKLKSRFLDYELRLLELEGAA